MRSENGGSTTMNIEASKRAISDRFIEDTSTNNRFCIYLEA